MLPSTASDVARPADARRRSGPSPVLAWGAAMARRLRSGPRFSSYRTSLIVSISLLVAATGAVVTLLAFRSARAGTTDLAHALFEEVSDHAVTRTRGFLLRAVPIAQGLGNLADLGLATEDPDRLARQLTVFLRANPGVSWVSYSDEAGSFVGAYRPGASGLRVNRSWIVDGRVKVREHDVLDD